MITVRLKKEDIYIELLNKQPYPDYLIDFNTAKDDAFPGKLVFGFEIIDENAESDDYNDTHKIVAVGENKQVILYNGGYGLIRMINGGPTAGGSNSTTNLRPGVVDKPTVSTAQ